MADPAIFNIPEWTFIKVATNVESGFVNLVDGVPTGRLRYYSTYRDTGGSAPAVPTAGTIPTEAIEIFKNSNQAIISAIAPIDVYIMCGNTDDITSETGKVRIDL